MKKVTIITHEYYPVLCGGTVFVDKIARAFSGMGLEIEVLTTGVGSGFDRIEINDRFKVVRFYTGRTSKHDAKLSEHLRFLLFGLPQMFRYLRRERTGLLFCVFAIPSGLIGVILSKLLRVPSVVFVDAADVPGIQSAMKGVTDRLKPVFQFVTRHATAVTILDGLEDVAKPLVRNSITAIIPNGTSIPSLAARPGTSGAPRIELLSIGRLVLRKGFLEIIQALALVKKKTSNFHLTIVGYGTREDAIRRLLEENDLAEHVTMTGRVEYEKLVEYYLNSDCYLFYGDREGSSLAMIEALSYGLPIIATDHPGTTTFVRDGINGMLVEPKNVKKLSEAILQLIENKQSIPELGRNSRDIAECYTWEKIAEQYHRVFLLAHQKCPS